MSKIGLDVSHRVAWPSPSEVKALGVELVRTVCYDPDELAAAIDELGGACEVATLVENQTIGVGDPFSSGDWRPARKVVKRVCAIPGVRYVSLWNELDLWRVPVELAARAAIELAPIVAQAGKQPILTSVTSGDWQGYLERLVALLPAEIRALMWADVHPYGRRARGFPTWFGWGTDGWEAECAYALARARELTGLPCVATESGIKLSDANRDGNDIEDDLDDYEQAVFARYWVESFRELDEQAHPFACYFCWADVVGNPDEQGEQAFGLRRHGWTPRPAWYAFQAATGGVAVPPPAHTFEMGFARLKGWLRETAGDAVEDELPMRARSEQATTTGLMSWVGRRRDEQREYGPELQFYEFATGRRYVLYEESGLTEMIEGRR